jgi:hypothetical protein
MGRRLFGSWMMASRRGRPVGCLWTYTTVAPISKELSARVVSTEIVRPRDVYFMVCNNLASAINMYIPTHFLNVFYL